VTTISPELGTALVIEVMML